MKSDRFTDAQIMGVIRQAEGGVSVPDLCRELAGQAVAHHGSSIGLDNPLAPTGEGLQAAYRRRTSHDPHRHRKPNAAPKRSSVNLQRVLGVLTSM